MKKFLAPLTLLIINLFIIISCFKDGLVFAGSEEGIPFYNLIKHKDLISSVWYEIGTGYPLTILIPRIPYMGLLSSLLQAGVSEIFLQAATFFILMFTGSISFYFLVKETIGAQLSPTLRERVSLISGIFYLLNPYSMTQVWGRALFAQMFSFALMPLFLLLIIMGIKRRKLYYAILAVFASFFLSPAFVMVTQVMVIWVPVLIYFLFNFLISKKRKDRLFNLVYLVFLIITWILVHSWWLIPSFKIGGQVFSVSSNNLEENLGSLRGVSAHFSLSYVLRLMQKFYFFTAKTYGEVYSSVLFRGISWLIPAVAIFSISYFKKIKELRFFLILFLVGLFVSLGASKPFGKVFIWFFTNFPILQAFRNPYEKFGLVFLLSYTPFFALGLIRLSKIVSRGFSRLMLIIILFAVCGIFVWPIWTGDFAGKVAWTEVPDFYKEADQWLSSQEGDGRIIQFPLISSDGVKYNWEHPYLGIEPSEFLFTRESIGRNVIVNKIYYNVLLQRFGNFSPGSFGPDPDISKSEFRSENLYEELAKLNVRYIVFHNDLDDSVIGSGVTADDFKSYLEKEKNIKKVKTFGELDIYSVDIPKEISLVYSPQAQVIYSKIDSTYYEVYIRGAKDRTDIYFLELFDPKWEATVNSVKQENHWRVFDYANAWTIKKDGDYKVSIDYKPQKAVVKGWLVSKYSLIALSVLLFLSLTKRKKNEKRQ